MNASDLRNMSDIELNELLLGLGREQFNLRMQRATGQLSKPDRLRHIRRDIARINTVLAQKGVKI